MGFRQNLIIISVICTTAAITVAFSANADDLASRLSGRMLLQVERRGEAWWVNPDTHSRVYLSKPSSALETMRQHGLGISNEDLKKIPVGLLNLDSQDQDGDGLHNTLEDSLGTNPSAPDSDGDGLSDREEVLSGLDPLGPGVLPVSNLFATVQSGRIFIQVESRGEAWWVNPEDHRRYYLGRPAEAYQIMRSFGVGISDSDIARIAISTPVVPDLDREAAETATQAPAPEETVAKTEPQPDPRTDEATSDVRMPALLTHDTLDCGSDLDCLSAAVSEGGSAEAKRELHLDDSTVSADLYLRYLVAPTEEGRYALVTETLNSAAALSSEAHDHLRGAGASGQEISRLGSAATNGFASMKGGRDWCLFDGPGYLREVLSRWGKGQVTHADFDRASCCSLNSAGEVDLTNCDADFPVSGDCLLAAHPSQALELGDEPDERVTRYAGPAEKITWSSSNEEVVALRETSGETVTVDALSPGASVITVTDGGRENCSVSYTLTVNE